MWFEEVSHHFVFRIIPYQFYQPTKSSNQNSYFRFLTHYHFIMNTPENHNHSIPQNSTANISKRSIITVSPGDRFIHHLIDIVAFYGIIFLVIVSINLIALQFNIDPDTVSEHPFMAIAPTLIFLLLYFTFELFFQQTPGKMIMKSYVIKEDGSAPSAKTLLIRTFSRIVPFEPFSCLNERGWHDTWSKTYVVKKDELEAIKRFQKEQSGDHIIDSLVTD